MATLDISHKKDFSEKKQISIGAATVEYEHFVDKSVSPNTTNNSVKLFGIPENSIIIGASIVVEEKTEAANMKIQLTVGNTNTDLLGNSATGAADGTTYTSARLKQYTGTGGFITLVNATNITKGKITVIVEYIEYSVSTGKLTSYLT